MTLAVVSSPCVLVAFNGADARAACFAFLWIPASARMTGLAGMTGFLRNDVCGWGGIAAVGESKPPLIPPWASRGRVWRWSVWTYLRVWRRPCHSPPLWIPAFAGMTVVLHSSVRVNGKRRSTCRGVGKVEFIECCFVL